ncbi:MAG TPA: hypothetical protein VNT76_08165, partial [Candidatus Binatus sp.]|nr:hypothetical protein [Candidatus Binatus sp.]
MDDRRPQIFSSAFFARFAACGFKLLMLIALTSCLATKLPLPAEPSPTVFTAITQDIAKFRGLEIRREIALTRYTPSGSAIDTY